MKPKKSKPKRTPEQWAELGYSIGVEHDGVRFNLTPENYKRPKSELVAEQLERNAEREEVRGMLKCKCEIHNKYGSPIDHAKIKLDKRRKRGKV